MNIYLCEIIGDGSDENPFRTAMADHISRPNSYDDADGRINQFSTEGVMLTVVYGLTPGEAESIEGDPRIVEITDKNLDALTPEGIPQPKASDTKTISNTITKRLKVRMRLKNKDFRGLTDSMTEFSPTSLDYISSKLIPLGVTQYDKSGDITKALESIHDQMKDVF